jgi:hypothetical protein
MRCTLSLMLLMAAGWLICQRPRNFLQVGHRLIALVLAFPAPPRALSPAR